jgi:ribonuclease D
MIYPESITKEELDSLPPCIFEGPVYVIDNQEQARKAVTYLLSQPIIGIDSETKPSFKKGVMHNVSLLQVSTGSECFLFRINKIGFTDELKELFETESVRKVGLSLRDDMRGLRRLKSLKPKGFIDLQDEVSLYGIEDKSLKKITGIVLGKRISKRQRLTNWECDALTDAQQRYAATDAWVCLEIFNKLTNGKN